MPWWKRPSYLVVADIAQYFEIIRFRPLRKQVDGPLSGGAAETLRPCVDSLFACLNGWTPYDGYGLPQNVDASSFLGNLFLDYIDKMMGKEGYTTFRYMDDIRIVVPTEALARRAIIRLTELLRELGLGLNSSKTRIIPPGSGELEEYIFPDDPDVLQIEAAVNEKTRDAVQGIVGLLFHKTSCLIKEGRCGDRTFRFCINRISSIRSYRNVDLPDGEAITTEVLRLLVTRPAETDTFCRYLEMAPFSRQHDLELERLLVAEPLAVYSWQNFHLWRLVSHRGIVTDRLTAAAHALLRNEPHNPETAAAALYLGRRGDYADRHAIAHLLQTASRGFMRRSFQVAIQELNKSERSQAYREVAAEDRESEVLSDHLSALHEPIYVQDAPEVAIEDLPDAMPSVYA